MVRILRPAVAAFVVTIVSMTSGRSAFAGDAEPVDDEELVDALVDASAAASWPLDEACVAAVVAGGEIENLDDALARKQLLDMLAVRRTTRRQRGPARVATTDP